MKNQLAFSILTAALIGVSAAAHAAPETYTIDNGHTFPRFSYSHFGFSTQVSRFNKTSGTVVFDGAAKTGAVDVTIDTTSVDTGFALFNGHIQGSDFLDTANYPTATFKSTAVHFTGDAPSSVDGNLTIKGVTKPVTLTVTSFKHGVNPIVNKDEIGANATVTIKRSDFGAGKYAPNVGDEVTITLAIEALKN